MILIFCSVNSLISSKLTVSSKCTVRRLAVTGLCYIQNFHYPLSQLSKSTFFLCAYNRKVNWMNTIFTTKLNLRGQELVGKNIIVV